MISESIPDLKKLSPKEKLILATELWEDFRDGDSDGEMDEAVYQLLEERFEAYRKDPAATVTWDDFKKRLGRS